MNRRTFGVMAFAFAVTIPWIAIWTAANVLPMLGEFLPVLGTEPLVTPEDFSTGTVVAVSGLSVLGASFLLAWGAETAEKDVPRAFAIAVLAILAVAPEYAVDALYAFNAGAFVGTDRGVEAGNLAVANMTGANRILIGIGWSGIAVFSIVRYYVGGPDPAIEERDGFLANVVTLDRDLSLEIVFLFAATVWAFMVPLNDAIDVLDMLILVGIYVAYILIVLRGPIDPEEEHVGVPAYLQQFPRPKRVATVLFLFAYSGLMIFTAVEPFAHGLEDVGKNIGVPAFFMIQWVAPLASESPELIVVVYLVNKARTTAGFNALISSKLNQWTLLIGTLVVVYSIGLGRYGALPFDATQSAEIWLTAAQSMFALSILVNFEISIREAAVLLVLFCSQVLLEFMIIRDLIVSPVTKYESLLIFTGIYIVLAVVLFAVRRRALRSLLDRTAGVIRAAVSTADEHPGSAD
ncbi:sodium:calcium antiporter [Halobacteriales archaeon QS_8_69_26]|nr:MAG: sodium:calcium antiporter [Halobacteriales archaeon QS_8_69_26]